MSFSGVCHVCEAAEGRHTCDKCGALVCDDHYDTEQALCTRCVAALGGRADLGEGDDSGMQM